ncbi:unnamed protein product [Brassica oleracea var. botrytis]
MSCFRRLTCSCFERVVRISKLGGGGGQLNVPPGRWLMAPFNLTSHMTLFLTEDSEIVGVESFQERRRSRRTTREQKQILHQNALVW